MTENQIKLIIGSLLHDIGKVVYRSGDGRNHSQSGYDYLKDDAGIKDKQILNCVRFHHGSHLKYASIADNDYAYITYFADNIAAASDRREGLETEDGFDKSMPLSSIFNILNNNHENLHFEKKVLDPKQGINYPTSEPVKMDEQFYREISRNIQDNLKGITLTNAYVNSLLAILEANLTYIPSSTSKREQADISLYDHVKMTAAIAQCIEQYFSFHKIDNYRKMLLEKRNASYEEKMFLLYSMDISGIQNFIYTIRSKGALKGLRARSFYLEMIMEHIIDKLLVKLSLSRANLIYSGGGHCYMILPNTDMAKQVIEEQEKENNRWFLKTFGTALYIAGGYVECCTNELKNEPKGSYSQLYIQISAMISGKKAHRYDAKEILYLNSHSVKGERECKICRKMDQVDDQDRCSVCAALEHMSAQILHQMFFSVIEKGENDEKYVLPLPGDKYLVADTKESLIKRMDSEGYIRCYSKNSFYTGKHVTTKLWVGDYTTGETFEELAEKAEGIKRIGILRADVDNLGTAFVFGFQRADGNDQYVTFSRTATLSRMLSLFFKCYINQILKNGEEDRLGQKGTRNVLIVYSGGDDVFLAGAWNEVIEAFMDLQEAFKKFTQGTLTISGGIGLYHAGYPINVMAKEVAELEESAKSLPGKNAISLFEEKATYSWTTFRNNIIGEKYAEICTFFEETQGYGKAFLYNLLELLRDSDEKINFARYVYFLSRMEPEKDSKKQKEAYQRFSGNMYRWIKSPEDRQETITAIYLYVYLTREEE